MSEPKFKPADAVIIKGVKHVISTSTKDFSTNVITYHLDNGELYPEPLLLKAIGTEPDDDEDTDEDIEKAIEKTIETLRETYEKTFQKPVPSNKKNDLDWMESKIEAYVETDDVENHFKVLADLSRAQLDQFIQDKELDIDSNDYDADEDLLKAICDELEVEIPSV